MMQGGMMGYEALNQGKGNQGGISQPYGGPTGMDSNRAGQLLNPAGIGGSGGLGKSGVEAFLDPAGIDSGPMGLNLFGKRPDPNAGQNPLFPNLGPASLIPQMPAGGFVPLHNGNGPYNNMASMGAGGQTFAPQFAAAHPTNPNGPVHPAMAGNKPIQVPGIGGSPGNTAMTYAMKNLPKDIGNRRT